MFCWSSQLRSSSRFFRSSPMALGCKTLNLQRLANQVPLQGQNVLVRVDLNVPLAEDQKTVTDDTRLRAIVPTTKFLLEQGANVILCSHFGRPEGEVIESGKNGRLTPVVKPLEALLGQSITKVDDCVGSSVEEAASSLHQGDILLLENTRFHQGEIKNDPALSAGLARLAKYFVMDAFGTAHRAHSSTAGVAGLMELSAAGLLLEKELDYLQEAVDYPKRPMMAIVGGAKVSTKIPVIESLLDKCDTILIGGGMMFTFYKAMGYDTGKSLVENNMVELAKNLLDKAKAKGVKLLLPSDVVLADAFENNAKSTVCKVNEISGDWIGLDIGPETIARFGKEIESCSTIIWNGPMGVFEMPNFAEGTNQVAKMLAEATQSRGAVTIVGGGDSVAAINQAGLGGHVSHVSTGGGASLELLEGRTLPGVAALTTMP